jgi:hypothetical protein
LVLEALEVLEQSVELVGHPTTQVLLLLVAVEVGSLQLLELHQQTPAALAEVL